MPLWQVAIWAAVALAVVPVFGPRFAAAFRPSSERFFDFSQEWLSARNYYTGSPVYSPQSDAVMRHMGKVPVNSGDLLPWNANPPASILLALPFGNVADYTAAHYLWNLATFPLFLLGLMFVRGALGVPLRWYTVFPAVVLILVSSPVFVHLDLGQLNFVLLPLLALSWWADRRDRQIIAGLALGLAAGLMLFPGFLFVYFLFAWRWRALIAGLLAAVAVNGLAWLVFGGEAFATYVQQVVPSLAEYQSSWRNVSVNGFWLGAFDPQPADKIAAVRLLPRLGHVLALASQLVITAITAWFAFRTRTSESRDRAVAVATLGMLLTTPVAWTHYFVLLAVPVAILWVRLPRGPLQWVFWLLVIPLWLPENFFAMLAIGPEQARLLMSHQHKPIDATTNIVALSAFTYVLLAQFVLAWFVRSEPGEPVSELPGSDPDVDLPEEEQRVDRRLFGRIGDD